MPTSLLSHTLQEVIKATKFAKKAFNNAGFYQYDTTYIKAEPPSTI